MEKPTPRVSSANLPQYIGRTVRLVGKVIQHSGDSALVEACDHGQVRVDLTPGNTWNSKFVEVVGRVNEDGASVQEFTTVNLGDNFDMPSYAQLATFVPQFQSLFGQ